MRRISRIWLVVKAFSRLGLITSGLLYIVALTTRNPLFLEVIAVISSVFIVARIQALKEENGMKDRIRRMTE